MEGEMRKNLRWKFCSVLSGGPKAFNKVAIKGPISPVFIITAELVAPVVIIALFYEFVFTEPGTVYFRVEIVI